MVDYYPSGLTAFAIASTLVCATWTDYTRARWPVLVYMSIACIISSIILLIWSTPTAAKFFAYCKSHNPPLFILPPGASGRKVNHSAHPRVSSFLFFFFSSRLHCRLVRRFICGAGNDVCVSGVAFISPGSMIADGLHPCADGPIRSVPTIIKNERSFWHP